MRLLIITQAIDENNPVLGFFCRWVEEFAKHYEKITVICLEKGKYNFPENVSVFSLGKEKNKLATNYFLLITAKLKYILNFYKLIFKLRNDYDPVFIHMNPEYVILGGLFWKVQRKRIGMWYLHRQTNFKLWVAEKIADTIFTSSPESFRLKSEKVSYLGHGVDVSKFICEPKEIGEQVKLLHVGRITKIKNCDVAIMAAALLNKDIDGKKFILKFVGGPVSSEDKIYLEKLKSLAKSEGDGGKVIFAGFTDNKKIVEEYCACDATLNLTPDGGMDKVVLESLVSNRPVFTSNKAFKSLLSQNFIFNLRDPNDLAKKILNFVKTEGAINDLDRIYDKVKKDFSIKNLINHIVLILNEKTS